MDQSKNKFTFRIALSYLTLCALALIAGYFIYSEIQVFFTNETAEENDAKLLKTGALVTQLYEAESLSKLAQQKRTKKSFGSYAQKIDSIFNEIDTLKQLTADDSQKSKLDSVRLLLEQKLANSNELLNLKLKQGTNTSIDNALEEFQKMEASFGKLTIYNFEKHPEQLSPYKRKVLEDWVAYLNENIPADTLDISNTQKIDSILNASKTILAEVKRKDAMTQRFLAQKENEIIRTDLQLSQQLRNIVSTFEKEVLVNTYNNNLKKEAALRRSIRLAGVAALLGLLVTGLFTFLINRDFWKVQTYRKKLEKQKKYSESLLRSREQLISTVSHDLRTPLNTIQGYTELMENTELTQKQTEYLKNINSATGYVGNLANDLLDFSKLEAGKLKIEKVPFIPESLILETARNLQTLYQEKHLEMKVEIAPLLQNAVLGDPFRLRQILTNLIGNAFKFTEEGSLEIVATASKRDQKTVVAKIDVTDTGIGIPKEKQQLIFQEFTQAETDTEKKFGGYGLGLTISRKLSELLGGSLHLRSKPGQGSTFTLNLPFEVAEQKVKILEHHEKINPLGTSFGVLIIDDDTALLGMLRELVESLGLVAHIHSNFHNLGKEDDLPYDVVLTDIQMPEISGFEVLERLKSGNYRHYTHQPIIAMTGRKDLNSTVYTEAGFVSVLQKPFSKRSLVSALHSLGIVASGMQSTSRTKKQTTVASIYNLDILRSFLGDNEDAVTEVLRTFLSDTQKNMQALEEAIVRRDYHQMNRMAHRMLPMFRQLQVKQCIGVLEQMETASPKAGDTKHLLEKLRRLKMDVKRMTRKMERFLTKDPSYSG